MKRAKERTIDKKRVNKANKIAKTEASRARRISNKHKRQEIHDIDPNLKVFIMNEKTYDIHGIEIEVMNGKIKAVTPADYDDAVIEYQEVIDAEDHVLHQEAYNAESDGGRAINDQIEKERIGMFNRLSDRFKKK